MEIYKQLAFEPVTVKDIDDLTRIMKRAFDEDTRRHLGKEQGGPPGYDNGDFIRDWYINAKSDAYKVFLHGTLIGAVNIFCWKDNERFLGNIFIDPSYQDKGLGFLVWQFIENKYPNTRKWQTETPGFSTKNHHFYINKCGFEFAKIEKFEGEAHFTITLEKNIIISMQ
ncbi:GNAT family N-acetyltransferase [Edaphovirga cremea]|uniref:GNAT family N-acetyltransferase n=1 Tax=Edaphovirga cremea TaxID=2267246 RepID=UPI000DEFFB4F|nr:GNAT family N-acetyltransferase [Edaphovirga cremea]